MAQPQPTVPRFRRSSRELAVSSFSPVASHRESARWLGFAWWAASRSQHRSERFRINRCRVAGGWRPGETAGSSDALGGVQFHWESGQRYFEIELVDPRSAHYYFVDPATETEAEGDLHVGDSLEEVLHYAGAASAQSPNLSSVAGNDTWPGRSPTTKWSIAEFRGRHRGSKNLLKSRQRTLSSTADVATLGYRYIAPPWSRSPKCSPSRELSLAAW